MQQKIRTKFKELFNTEGSLYTSPGRINLIGEHTDYNGGFVFPGAVDKGMIAEIKPNGTGKVRAFSIDLNDYAEFGLTEEDAPSASWARYIFGVCREIIKRGGNIQGFDTVFAGDVPGYWNYRTPWKPKPVSWRTKKRNSASPPNRSKHTAP